MSTKEIVLNKILVVRFSSIGDVILTSPIVRCIKNQTGAELHYLTKAAMCSLVNNNPYIDKVIAFDKKDTNLLRSLKDQQYDLIVDLHHNLRSRKISWSLGVKTIRFHKANIEKWLKVNFKCDRLPKQHLVDRYFDALRRMGIRNDHQGLDFFINERDHKSAEAYIKQSKNIICISLGASFFTKRIPVSKIQSWIKAFDESRIILIGGKDVLKDAHEIEEQFPQKVVNLCGKINLQTSAAIIKNSKVLITGDTATMHMGAALNTSMISVWGNTIPEFGMSAYYGNQKNKNFNLEVKDLSCRPCSKLGHDKCPKGHFKCMFDQSDSRLIEQVYRLTDQ